MPRSSSVLLLIPHLGGGGAERVTELLARNLSMDEHEIHLCLITQAAVDSVSLPRHLTVHALGAKRVRHAVVQLVLLIWRLRPAVIFSGIAHLNLLVLLLSPLFPRQTRVFVRQNGPVSATLATSNSSRTLRLVYRLLYRKADQVICQSRAMAREVSEFTGIPMESLAVLANPIDIDAIRATSYHSVAEWTGPGPHLLAVGRLSREKGFDLLLHAFAEVKLQFPTADLAIAGAGPEKPALEELSEKLELSRAVRFLGRVENPAIGFPGASMLVISSRYEGLPNAMLEAAAGGLPIVAVPASEGLLELLDGQPGVWLASDVSSESLAESLMTALKTIRPGQRFAHSWIEVFGLRQSIQTYKELFDSAARMRAA
jgi:glycosyltransferase involved in cell wall biosynthesis